MLKNQCFIFLTTNAKSYERFLKIKSCNFPGIDFYYVLDVSVYSGEIPDGENVITFNGDEVWKRWNGMIFHNKFLEYKLYCGNPQFMTIEFFNKNFGRGKNYQYYWFCEDDIFMPNGDYYWFFKDADKVDCDFLHMKKIYDAEEDGYTAKNTINDLKAYTNVLYESIPKPMWGKYRYWTWLMMFRISKKGCDVVNRDFKKVEGAHTELCIPSIITNHKMTTHCMSDSDVIGYKFHIHALPLNPTFTGYENVENTFYHPMKII